MARTYVWSGFGPFLDYPYNPSWDAAQAAAEASDGVAHLLEVSFDAALGAASLWRAEDGPATIVHIGLAAARDHVCFERFAHNARGGRDDRLDATPEDRARLEEGGPLARETRLLLGRLVDLYRESAGSLPPARVTRDAGTFVCNATYYHALGAHAADGVDVLFVHIPSLEPEAARALGAHLADTLRRYYEG